MSESSGQGKEKKRGLARRLFSTVGQAAEGVLRTAGQTVKGAGDRVRLTFSGEIEETPVWELRAMAESLTQWLVEECKGSADLQQQKPSTVELSLVGQSQSYFQILMEEPGLAGRRFRFVLRAEPLNDLASNFPVVPDSNFTAELLIVRRWPKSLAVEPKAISCLVWEQAAAVGPRNSAQDLGQRWLSAVLGASFPRKKVLPAKIAQVSMSEQLLGREQELTLAREALLTPESRVAPSTSVLALAAPGGTGKSFFLRALKQQVDSRVIWAGVDHQCFEASTEGSDLLGKVLATLAKALEAKGLSMAGFRKEYLRFQKGREGGDKEARGFFRHVRKALETAAGFNPAFRAASAGAAFLSSWGEEWKEQSEALARDDTIVALTQSFKDDLKVWSDKERERALLWRRPVLVFDTYEWLAPLLDVWLRTQLIGDDLHAQSQTAVIVAGRDHPLKVDTRWAEFSTSLLVLELAPFSRETSFELLRKLRTPEARHEELFELTGGLPLYLSLAAQISSSDQVLEVLGKRILEEVPKEFWGDFRRASLLDHFTSDALSRLFPDRTAEELERLAVRIDAASFTESREGRRAFLPAVRRVLQQNLRLEVGENAYVQLRSERLGS